MFKVIGLTGHIGVGKSTYAYQLLRKELDQGRLPIIIPLANELKKLVFEIFGVYKDSKSEPVYNPPKNEFLKRRIEEIELYKEKDVRKILQKFGADVVRCLDEDYFVNIVCEKILALSQQVNTFIIDDIRFLNEERKLREVFGKNFILLKLERPLDKILQSLRIDEGTYRIWLQHQSEVEIEQLSPDEIIHVKEAVDASSGICY